MKNQKANRTAKRQQQKRIKSITYLALGGLLLLALAAFIVKANQPPATVEVKVKGSPSLTVDKERVDLGNVKLGNLVTVSFQLSNEGDQPLTVNEAPYVDVQEGC